ncbi:zinc finger protein 714-like [Bradysia coprophila]|uniref:zinc finger protein 714-like n=1 Tax=Bradysia coprophila TaxID=38358 RepID=UPI00187D8BF6|nr:zinc finger protein 714-like [Bradysia coprophila]
MHHTETLQQLDCFSKDENGLTHTGEILLRRDGNYCFSCNHCNEYFDLVQEIIAHIRNVLLGETGKNDQCKLRVVSETEFVDVLMPVKYEPNDDCMSDGSSANDGDDNGNDNCADVMIEVRTEKPLLDNRRSTENKTTIADTISLESLSYSMNTSACNSQNDGDCDGSNTTIDQIKCCWCSATFDDVGLVQNHLTDDHNKKSSDVYCCERCCHFFRNRTLLSEHILSCHGVDEHERFRLEIDYQENTKPMQCSVCQIWKNGTKAFESHTKNAHKMYRILQCYVCGIFKKKPSGLLDHLKVHDRFRKYRCYECDNVEPKITNPNDRRSHKCVLCGIWFLNHTSMRNHLTSVHGQDQIYDCAICDDFSFKTESDLKTHVVNVHDVRAVFECKICSKHCRTAQSLNVHKRTHAKTSSSTNVCSICGSKFRRKDYLMRHIKSHSDANKDFKCYICNKGFQSNGYLKNHIKRHTEQKIHQCHVCGVRFLLHGLLRKHMKEHEGEVWKCTQCPKEFSNKSKLTAHEKTHVTERNFRCDVCSKTYKTSKNLRQHKLIHSAERRIKCRICNMTFNQGPEHELHLQTHTSELTC